MRIPYLTLAALLATSLHAAEEQLPSGKVYSYKTVDGTDREVEIFFPENHCASGKTVPGILLFHGGGWGGGKRSQFAHQCAYFASRGLVAGTVTYRLATKKEKNAAKDSGISYKRYCIADVKSAIRWFKQQAGELGVDPQRVIVGGGSAGGHISLLGTTNPGLNDPDDPKGFDTSVIAYLLFNPALSANDSQDPGVDFLQHLKPGFPPAIAFFGSDDKWAHGWEASLEKMKELGIETTDTRIAEGQGHGFFNNPPWREITLIEADRFLARLGLIEGEPTLAMPETGEKLVKQQ